MHNEHWRLRITSYKLTTHGYGTCGADWWLSVQQRFIDTEAAVKAQTNTRPCGCIGLTPFHSSKYAFPCVFLSPHGCQTLCAHGPTKGAIGVVRPTIQFPSRRAIGRELPVEVIFLRCSKSCVRIGGANDTKLIWVNPDFLLELHTAQQC